MGDEKLIVDNCLKCLISRLVIKAHYQLYGWGLTSVLAGSACRSPPPAGAFFPWLSYGQPECSMGASSGKARKTA